MIKKIKQIKQHDKEISYENPQKLAINKVYFYQIVFTIFFNECFYMKWKLVCFLFFSLSLFEIFGILSNWIFQFLLFVVEIDIGNNSMNSTTYIFVIVA